MTQAAFIITLGMAEVFVLLLGEIDLAAGFTAACGAVIALWMWRSTTRGGWPCWPPGRHGGLRRAPGPDHHLASIALVRGHAGRLSRPVGLLLFLINATGKIGVGGVIHLNSNVLNDIESGWLSPTASWIVMIALVALAGVMLFRRDQRRRSRPGRPAVSITLLKIAVIAIAGVVVVLIGNANRGSGCWPCAGCPGWCWSCSRSWCLRRAARPDPVRPLHLRHRRQRRGRPASGVNTNRIRVGAFALCGLTAGITGIIYASYLGSISTTSTAGRTSCTRGGRGDWRDKPVRRAGQDDGRPPRRPGRRHDL